MKDLTAECSESELVPSEGKGFALAVRLTSSGDEAVQISGVFLSRKGLNALPEFAEGFGLDYSNVVEGLSPERYQIRVEMLLSHKGRLLYGNGRSEFSLLPSRAVRFILPLPFQGVDYFLGCPSEDLFIAVTRLHEQEHSIEVPELQNTMRRSIEQHGHLGAPYNVNFSVVVPMKEPPSEEELRRMVGKTNPKPIRRMPNT